MDRAAAQDLLARLHAAQGEFYAGGTDAALRTVLTPDVGWHVPGDNDIAGDYSGFADVVGYFTRRRALAHGSMRLHLRELLTGDGPYVAAFTDGTATVGQVAHRWATTGLYRTSGSRVAECWLLPLAPRDFDRIWTTTHRAVGSDSR